MPNSVEIRFCGDLQDLLSHSHRKGALCYDYSGSPAVKDGIEACGVPHTEVDLILADGRSVDFSYRLQGDHSLEVFPPDYPADRARWLVPSKPEPVSFVLDVHLGKLARRLRLLGFDCLYRNDYPDREIIHDALVQQRAILTRDRGILKHRSVIYGLLIRSDRVDEQIREVFRRYLLTTSQLLLEQRCPLCNGVLEAVEKSRIRDRLLPKTIQYYSDFLQCSNCGKIYWEGAHFRAARAWLNRLP